MCELNAEKIARALRSTCEGCNPTPCCEFEVLGPAAADLIESLTAENKRLTEISESNGQAIGLLTSDYEAQLTASQRMADKAVEDIERIKEHPGLGLCVICKHGHEIKSGKHCCKCDGGSNFDRNTTND